MILDNVYRGCGRMVVKIEGLKHYEPWMVENDKCVYLHPSLANPTYAFWFFVMHSSSPKAQRFPFEATQAISLNP